MKTFYTFLFFVAWVVGMMCWATSAHGAQTEWPRYQYLMVDQHGHIRPEGYAAGLTEIAAAEANAALTRQAANLVTQTAEAASNVVDEIVTALTGSIGICYVTGHTISFSGAVLIDTNVAAYVVLLQPKAAGAMATNGVAYSGHYVWHAYSAALNSVPLVKYRSNLDATNAWQFAEYQSTAEFSNTNIAGTVYATIYRSTVWLPSSYDSSFFEAFVEIKGDGSAGALLDIYGGISIGGKTGYTGDLTRDGKTYSYITGVLMSITNGVAQ